jgi:TolB protein
LVTLGLVVQATAGPLSERFFIVAESGPLSKIFVVREDGRDWQRLTRLPGSEADAAYSAARQEVFYRRWIQGDWELSAWNLEAQEDRVVHVSRGLDRQPTPSPDGSQLAFTSDRFGNDEIMLLPLNEPDAEVVRLTWDQGQDCSPSWSPDGRQLAFASRRNGQSDLYIIDLASEEQRRLTRSEQDEVDPRWSPDGSKILFQTVEGRYRTGRLGWVEVATDQVTMLPEVGGSAHQASWSPDGSRLLYLDYRSARQPSSPALTTFSLSDRSAQPVTLYRRGMELTHWSFRQASWTTTSLTP